MAQHLSSPQDLPADFVGRVLQFPSREAPPAQADVPVRSARRTVSARTTGVRRRVIRQVVVLEVAGPLSEVVVDLDQAIRLALAEGPRGVVCDLSAVLEASEGVAVEVLATAGRHVRDWSGVPVAVACPDPRVREALATHTLGGLLIVTASLFSAVSGVLATPAVAVESVRLAPHPTAPWAAREFVTRTLLDWRLGQVVPFASELASELVTSSSVDAGTDIELSVAWNLGTLRLAVRDHGTALPGQPPSPVHSQGLSAVAGLSRAFGVLPIGEGGKVVWAVLDAPRPRPSTRPTRSGSASGRAAEGGDAPVLTAARIHPMRVL